MTQYDKLLKNPTSLDVLLAVADVDDLNILIDYITDCGEGRLALDSATCKQLITCRDSRSYTKADSQLIAKEILLFGGNSLANVYRSIVKKTSVGQLLGTVLPDVASTTDYESVVKDVAKQVSAAFGAEDDIIAIENAVLLKIFKQALDKMPEAGRKQILDDLGVKNVSLITGTVFLGYAAASMAARSATTASLSIASIVASAVSTQILGRVAFGAPMIIGTRPLAALAGPVGIAVGTLWTLAGLSSPAYRVTLPCVVQLAFMRQKYLVALNVIKFPKFS